MTDQVSGHRHIRWRLHLAVFSLCVRALGQSGEEPPPPFEAADVHVAPAAAYGNWSFLPKGRVEFRGVTLLQLITAAYAVHPEHVTGGPSWLDIDRYDVVAQGPDTAKPPQLRTMLQGLLAERFHLMARREEKPMPVHALVLADKRKLPKESTSSGAPRCDSQQQEEIRTETCRNTTMQGLVRRLAGYSSQSLYFEHPIVDHTGLTGSYDFELKWVPRSIIARIGDKNLSLLVAIEKLGIKIEDRAEPMTVLTVERADRKPVDNPPGTVEKLGADPTEFEVASIRLSRPDETLNYKATLGRVEIRAITLKRLISWIYDTEESRISGGDKWTGSTRYDIVAKTSPTVVWETIRKLLEPLLADRFRLKVHTESQPTPVYGLTAVKPKLKSADPSARSECKLGAGDGVRTYTCRNVTMAQFAEKIRSAAPVYIDHQVVDMTGLTGAYDLTVSWAPKRMGEGPQPTKSEGAADGATTPAPADSPSGGHTIFEAVEQQLGLKLKPQKQPMPVVVIDHVETPTEN